MGGKNLGGRPSGTHTQTVTTGVLVRIARDAGLGDQLPGVPLPTETRKRRQAADYAEDKLSGPSRQARKPQRQAVKQRLKAAASIPALGKHEDVFALADALCNGSPMSPLERKRGRRLVRALWNMELALVDQVGAFQRAQIDYLMADIRTPYGTRIADDLEIAIDDLGELRTRVRESREHLRAALAVRGETPRQLAWSTAREDYTTNPRAVLDDLEPVDDEWLERFSQAAERKRTPAEPAFAWELDGDATGAPNRSGTVIGYTGSWRSPDGAAPDDVPDLESDEPRRGRAVGAIRTRPYDAPRQKPAPVTVRFESRQIEKLAA